MQLKFWKGRELDFMGKRRGAMIFSGTLLVISLLAIAIRGLSFGLDFTGGTLIEVGFDDPVELAQVRSALDKNGFGDATVQHFGTARDVLIRIAPQGEAQAEAPDTAEGAAASQSNRVFQSLNGGGTGMSNCAASNSLVLRLAKSLPRMAVWQCSMRCWVSSFTSHCALNTALPSVRS